MPDRTYTARLVNGPADGQTRALTGYRTKTSIEVHVVTEQGTIDLGFGPVPTGTGKAALYRLRAVNGIPARNEQGEYVYDWDPSWKR